MKEPARILVAGGGHAGMCTALRPRPKPGRGGADIAAAGPQPRTTHQPFLPEAAAGATAPRRRAAPPRRLRPGRAPAAGAATAAAEPPHRPPQP